MKTAIADLLRRNFCFPSELAVEVARSVTDLILSPEFAALYRQQQEPSPALGMDNNLYEEWRIGMSKLTEAMTALGQQMASLNPAANAAHLQTIDDHLTKLDTEEGADEAAVADTTAGLQAFIDAANSTSASTAGTETASTAAGTTAASTAAS